MQLIEPYIKHLEKLVKKPVPKRRIKPYIKSIELATNGQLYKTLRKEVPINQLHASGAFFTGEPMANKIVASIPEAELPTLTALDPTCGGGNLLLALARRLPLADTLANTLTQWGQQLYGMDIHLEFVRATRARLVLLATWRGLAEVGTSFFACSRITPAQAFPHIKKADGLECNWPKVGYYLLNPPFNREFVPTWCRWATSKASQAAVFLSKCLAEAQSNSIIQAILPDVLRSGSNYKKWRRHIEHLALVDSIVPLGQFDTDTQVDVFHLTLNVSETLLQAPVVWVDTTPPADINMTIGSLYQVVVGRVVPQRDPEEGTEYPYLDVHGVKPWETIVAGKTRRAYRGVAFTPPFVVVRRNSKVKDANRAVGTIILAHAERPEQVAVENHLIVLLPNNGSLAECEALLARLQDQQTNTWLNARICCRHLTVSAVQSIPWWPNV